MSKQEKSRKPLIVGIIAAVVILAVLLVLLLTQCTGGSNATDSTPVQTTGAENQAPDYSLYWNLDKAEYSGKSEAGLSSRKPADDGYFYVRFFIDGEVVELKVADRKTINAIDVNDLMGLEFDEDGIVTGIIPLDDLPCEQVGWKFYVQSAARTLIKLNSSSSFNGLEVLLDIHDDTGIYDMTGMEGGVGNKILPIAGDHVIAIADLSGKLTHVFVFDRPTYMKTFEAECRHCKEVVEWNKWEKTNVLPTGAGHYQLQNDVALKAQQNMKANAVICLDLNGYAIDGGPNVRMYSMHNKGCELALMDSSEEQTGVLRGHATSVQQGGIVWIRYGTFYMYGGTLDASDMTSINYGTAVKVDKGNSFYMYGGTILGGTAKYNYVADTGKYTNGMGGAVAVQGGKFVMNDGLITGGRAQAAITEWNTDGTPKTYQRGSGGNIAVINGGEFEMRGGTIQNGRADVGGGNVYLESTSTMLMDGGVISGGQVMGKGRNGGNVFLSGTKPVLTMNGGYIINGKSRNCGGNMYTQGTVTMNGGYIGGGQILNYTTGKVNETEVSSNIFNVNGKFIMYGGHVAGGFNNIDTTKNATHTTVVLGGLAKITGEGKYKYPDLNLAVSTDVCEVKVLKLAKGAKIGVNTNMGIFTTPTSEDNLDNFYSNIEGTEVCYYNGCLAIGRDGCLCGLDANGKHIGDCDGTKMFWAPVSGNKLPTGSGNYYLLKDMQLSGACNMIENANINLDLNGYTLSAPKNGRAISLHNPGTVLRVTDSSAAKTGTIKSSGTGTGQGSVIWLRYGKAYLYQGTLDGSEFELHSAWSTAGKDGVWGTSDDTTSARNGCAIDLSPATTLTMYGGTVIGGKTIRKTHTKTVTEGEGDAATTREASFTTASGGGGAISMVAANAVFNMYGGTVTGGVSHTGGGNINIGSSGTANLYGGTIEGGFAGLYDEDGKTVIVKGVGGNIRLDGASATLNILGEDVVITGGKSIGNGGNIYFANSTVNMEDGTITAGESLTDQGGNLFISGTANLSGGTISDGISKNGGNIAINSSKDILLQGVTVTGGSVTGNGGNIRISSTNVKGQLTIAEGTVITDGQAKNGGNISIEPNNHNKNNPVAVCNITGATITGGIASNNGGNIYVAGGTTTGTGTATMNISGTANNGAYTVEIADGLAAASGGNIHINGGTAFTLDGASVHDGSIGTAESSKKDHNLSNVSVINAGNTATIGNVNVTGRFNIGAGVAVALTGKPVIKATTAPNLILASGVIMDVSGLDVGQDTAMIGITGSGKFASSAASEQTAYFFPDSTDQIFFGEAGLWIGEAPVKYCLCGLTSTDPEATHAHADTSAVNGCDGTLLLWQATNKMPNVEGNYYLTQDVNMSIHTDILDTDAVINLNLNGHVIQNSDYGKDTDQTVRFLRFKHPSDASKPVGTNVKLTIIDTVGTGVIRSDAKGAQGSFFWVNASGVQITLISGTLDASKIKWASNDHGANAIVLDAVNTGFTMYGGTFIGGNTPYGGDAVASTTGGASNIAIHGGTIKCSETSPTGVVIRSFSQVVVDGTAVIEGTVEINDKNTGKAGITLAGSPAIEEIYLSKTANNTLTPAANAVLPVITIDGELSNSTPIRVTTMGDIAGHFTGETVAANADNFTSNAHLSVEWDATANKLKLAEGAETCLCGSTDGTHSLGCTEVGNGTAYVWTPISSLNEICTTGTTKMIPGKYYLTADITTGSTFNFVAGETWIDLNGHSITRTGNARLFRNSGEGANSSLTITDLAGGGKLVSNATYTQGGLVWLVQGGRFNFLGGTMDVSGYTNTYANGGSAVAVQETGSRFYMYGGTIIGGTSVGNGNGQGRGGAVLVDNKNFMYMKGGTIRDGKASYQGGNIYVGGTFEMTNGTISGGEANPAFTEGNTNTNAFGGNIYGKAGATIILSGGTITGGTDVQSGRNISGNVGMDAGTGTLTIGNVTVDGYVTVGGSEKTINISGKPQFINRTDADGNAIVNAVNLGIGANKLTVGDMDAAASVGITADGAGVISTGTVPAGYADIFYSDSYDFRIEVTANGLEYVEAGTIHTTHDGVWTEITNGTTALTEGRWYLTGDTTASITSTSGNVIICLNGKTWSGDAALAVTDGDVRFCDCTTEGNGKISKVTVAAGKSVGMEGGNITTLEVAENATVTIKDGSVETATVASGTILTVNGGSIGTINAADGASVIINDGSVTTVNAAAAVINNGTVTNLNATSATIAGGKITNVDVDSVALSGAPKIDSLSADNLNVGTLSDSASIGIAANEAGVVLQNAPYKYKDIFTSANSSLKIAVTANGMELLAADAHVHCVCAGNLGNASNGYTVTFNDNTTHSCVDIIYTARGGQVDARVVATGQANWYLEENVSLYDHHFRLNNANINLCLNGHNWIGASGLRAIAFQTGTSTMSITTCKADELDSAGKVINNRVVGRDTFSGQGCAAWLRYGTLNLYAGYLDGTDIDSTATYGAAVAIEANSVLNMYGGSILGAETSVNGPSVGISKNGTMNLYNGTITGGRAGNEGGNMIVGGTLNIHGGRITGGKVKGSLDHASANIATNNAAARINMTGGEITGGVCSLVKGAVITVSGDAKITATASGHGLRIIDSGDGIPMIKLVVGDLSDDAEINITNVKSSDAYFTGVFADAAASYTITQQDMDQINHCVYNGGAGDQYDIELESNKISFVKK